MRPSITFIIPRMKAWCFIFRPSARPIVHRSAFASNWMAIFVRMEPQFYLSLIVNRLYEHFSHKLSHKLFLPKSVLCCHAQVFFYTVFLYLPQSLFLHSPAHCCFSSIVTLGNDFWGFCIKPRDGLRTIFCLISQDLP